MRNNPDLVNEILNQFKTVTKEQLEKAIEMTQEEFKEKED